MAERCRCPACDRGDRLLSNGVIVRCALCSGTGRALAPMVDAYRGGRLRGRTGAIVALERMAAQDAWAAGDTAAVVPVVWA